MVARGAPSALEQIGVSDTPAVALADTGYWHEQQIDEVVNTGTQVLIPPDAGKHEKPRRGWTGGRYAPLCGPSSLVTSAEGSTENARPWSSRCLLKPSTTGASRSFSGEADPPHAPNGD